VLKGAGTLVAADPPGTGKVSVHVCDRGNPGMATAGMGDVLSGVLGALLVQGGDLGKAARAGVFLHALAGDDAARAGQRGTIAGDLMAHIRKWANPS
jgi:NAD(P)H-hydrate repair Nnr-like enzyme with NAD(P)H-hydrate dehydratase domain